MHLFTTCSADDIRPSLRAFMLFKTIAPSKSITSIPIRMRAMCSIYDISLEWANDKQLYHTHVLHINGDKSAWKVQHFCMKLFRDEGLRHRFSNVRCKWPNQCVQSFIYRIWRLSANIYMYFSLYNKSIHFSCNPSQEKRHPISTMSAMSHRILCMPPFIINDPIN